MISKERKDFARACLGKIYDIIIDRPLASTHPKHKNIVYTVNYGYIPNVIGGDGEEMDVYLLGVDTPLMAYTAQIIGIIYRHNDEEDKLIAAPLGMTFDKEEIRKAVHFQEQYFDTEIEILE